MARVLLFVCGLLSVLACQAASPGGDNCELCKGWVKTLGHTDETGNPTVATAFTTPEGTFKYSLGADRQSFCAMQKHAHQFKCAEFWSHAVEQGMSQQSNLALALKFGIRLPAALACSWPKGTKAAQTGPDDACATNMCQAFGCRGAVAEKWAHNLDNVAMPAPKPVRGEQSRVTPPKPSPPVPPIQIERQREQPRREQPPPSPKKRDQQPLPPAPQQQEPQQQQQFQAEGQHHRAWPKREQQQPPAKQREQQQRRSPPPSPRGGGASATPICPSVTEEMKRHCAAAGGTFNPTDCKCHCRDKTTWKEWSHPGCTQAAFVAASSCKCATPKAQEVAAAKCFVNWKYRDNTRNCQNACRQIMAAMIAAQERVEKLDYVLNQCNAVNRVGDTYHTEYLRKAVAVAFGYTNTAAHAAAFDALVDHITSNISGNCVANCDGAARGFAHEFIVKVAGKRGMLRPEDIDRCDTIAPAECDGPLHPSSIGGRA